MKKAASLVLILFFVFAGRAFSQQKYGHINSDDILQAMPEYKQMNASLDRKQKDAEAEMGRMYQNYQARQKELNEYGMSMMQAVRDEKMKELDSLQQTIAVYEETVKGDLQKLQNKLMKPLNDKYLKIVNAVAKENGYTFIFDISSGTVVYYPEKTGDITEAVMKKMGIN